MRIFTVILVSASILTGAALVRGVTYALTHAVGAEKISVQISTR
jgi:hypothetical protein